MNAFAQDQKENVFSLRPAIGLNGAQIHGDSYNGFNKAGVFGGLSVNARLSKRLSIDQGFYFSQKGSRHNPNPEKNDYSFYFVNLNYLDLPLSLNLQLNKDFYLCGGPSFAYLISYYEETERGDWTGVYPFENYELGLNIALGKLIKKKFFVEVRSSNSITPIRSYGVIANAVFYPNAVAAFFNKGLYNNVLTFMIGYKLDLKKKNREPEEK
ncbi:MAG: PorT family protein [Sphingobacteriaceae bacterium]|nr:PorT family protein [Sphingobacteriaceae bacterium]